MLEDHQISIYQSVVDKFGYFPIYNAGPLTIQGPDRIDFLQRQTTRDLRKLTPGKALLSVLTSPVGRIIDVLCVYENNGEEAEPALQVLTLPGSSEKTARFLKSRIFFKDNVSVSDRESEISQVVLVGQQIQPILQKAGFILPELEEAAASDSLAGVPVRALRLEKSLGIGWRLLIPAKAKAALETALKEAGGVEISPAVYEVLRVENGLPGADVELTEAYTPLEVGLRGSVSENKGCYTGQEVIARQMNYDKVTRHLVGLKLKEPARVGLAVKAEDRTVGEITSYADSPRFGPLALAVIKRPYHAPGTKVVVFDEGLQMQAEVQSLPFE